MCLSKIICNATARAERTFGRKPFVSHRALKLNFFRKLHTQTPPPWFLIITPKLPPRAPMQATRFVHVSVHRLCALAHRYLCIHNEKYFCQIFSENWYLCNFLLKDSNAFTFLSLYIPIPLLSVIVKILITLFNCVKSFIVQTRRSLWEGESVTVYSILPLNNTRTLITCRG